MKSYILEARCPSEENGMFRIKIKAADPSRAIEIAERLKKEGKIDVQKNVSFKVVSPSN